MKRTLFILIAIGCLFVIDGSAQKASHGRAVHFEDFSGKYFEKNDSGLRGSRSYITETSNKKFDHIFGPAAINGENHFIPAGAFKTDMVVAAIKRGALSTYSNVRVTARGSVLRVSYNVKTDKPGSSWFRSPLLLVVKRERYRSVVFVENGRTVRTVKVG